MAIWNRNAGTQEAPLEAASTPLDAVTAETAECHVVSPGEFIASHASALANSSKEWAKVTDSIDEFSQPDYIAQVGEGLRTIYKLGHYAGSEETLAQDAQRTSADLGIWTLILARSQSEEKFGVKESVKIKHIFVKNADKNLNHLLLGAGKRLKVAGFNNRMANLIFGMKNADGIGAGVIRDLIRSDEEQPGLIADMAELYEEGSAYIDPRYMELRRIVATDWYHPDKSKSILRQHYSSLSERPDQLMDHFAVRVEQATHDKRLLRVKEMAQFAVAAMSGTSDNPGIKEVLRRTYARWGEFSDFDVAFDGFIKTRAAEAQRAVSAIAGPYVKKDIRSHRTQAEVDEFQRTLSVKIGVPLAPQGNSRKRRNAQPPQRVMPTRQDIIEAKETREKEKRQPKLMITKNAHMNGDLRAESVEASVDDVLENFKIEPGSQLAKDVIKIIKRVQAEPISAASRRIRSKAGKMFIDGKPVNLWRFAPEDSQGLNIHPDNRYRVVYGVSASKLLVVDVVDPRTFDRKY